MPPAKPSSIIPYLIVLLGFVVGYLYNSQLDPSEVVTPIPLNFQLTSLKGLDTLKIDYSVLTSDQFKQLRVFGQLPVPFQGGGKDNPFQ